MDNQTPKIWNTKGWRASRDETTHEIEGVKVNDPEREKREKYNEQRLNTEIGLKKIFQSILNNPTASHISSVMEELSVLATSHASQYDPELQQEMGWHEYEVRIQVIMTLYQVEDPAVNVDIKPIDDAWESIRQWVEAEITTKPHSLPWVRSNITTFINKHRLTPQGELIAADFRLLGEAEEALKEFSQLSDGDSKAGSLLLTAKRSIGKFLGNEATDKGAGSKLRLLAQWFWSKEEASRFIISCNSKGRKLGRVRPRTMILYGTSDPMPRNLDLDGTRDKLLREMEEGIKGIMNATNPEQQVGKALLLIKKAASEYGELFDSNPEYRKDYDTHKKALRVSRIWTASRTHR